MTINIPSDEIGREAFLIEAPSALVRGCAHLHAVTAGGKARLDHTIDTYQALTSQCIDLQCVPHVRIQKLEDGMHCTHLPMSCQDERLQRRMRPQPITK